MRISNKYLRVSFQ